MRSVLARTAHGNPKFLRPFRLLGVANNMDFGPLSSNSLISHQSSITSHPTQLLPQVEEFKTFLFAKFLNPTKAFKQMEELAGERLDGVHGSDTFAHVAEQIGSPRRRSRKAGTEVST